ncbi:aldo/keto reductase [Geomonas edaphica]|uniref:aldo/keto reductase n=1 Tax=Geomonas edaphica TaxID=2570226 RepID=UPI0010A911C4|nr:aldo/keto reductase [Geomonas edaphica]
MRYRQLGRTGLEVSEIGFGTWGLGGNSYGPVDDAVSVDALRYAYERGITFFDTSDLYGNGHSEDILGCALKRVRDKVVICSKVGLLPHSGFEMPCDFSPEHIRTGLAASLRRLQTDYLDLYLLHSPTLQALRDDGRIVETMEELKRQGQIRAYGISARSPADAYLSYKEFGLRAMQVNFNLIDQRVIDDGLLSLAGEEGIGLVARTPFCFGYLTGKLTGEESFAGIDHRANWPKGQLKRWASAPGLFSFLTEGTGRTPAQAALRYCLDHPEVSTVIPGMMSRGEIDENIAATELPPLSEDEMERVRTVYNSTSFYDPKAKEGL